MNLTSAELVTKEPAIDREIIQIIKTCNLRKTVIIMKVLHEEMAMTEFQLLKVYGFFIYFKIS